MRRPLIAGVIPLVLCAVAFASARADSQPPPSPCAAPEFHQFDFWIGTWTVATPDGKAAGTSRIERVAGGCAILEHWSGAKGGEGKSINFYRPEDGKWHQTWAGSGASFLFLDGALSDGHMVLTGTTRTPAGDAQIERITWTPEKNGTVTQEWAQSTDGGTVWTTVFTGIYTRTK